MINPLRKVGIPRRLRLMVYGAVMGSLEALPRLEAVSRQYFNCLGLGLGLEGHCLGLGLGLALTVLVLCLETKTVQGSGRQETPFCFKLLFSRL